MRRFAALLCAALLAAILAACGPGAAGDDGPTISASTPAVSSTVAVTYTVDVSDNPIVHQASVITYETPDGSSQATDEPMPWDYLAEFSPDDFLYVSAQNSDTGTISCSIKVDGETVAHNEATGQYAIVTCKG